MNIEGLGKRPGDYGGEDNCCVTEELGGGELGGGG